MFRNDLTAEGGLDNVNWGEYQTDINAAACSAVATAETQEWRNLALAADANAVSALAAKCAVDKLTLVHISSDYVIDGSQEIHDEAEPVAPLGVFGLTKAARYAIVASMKKRCIVRTSWVIGEGASFVATMATLADRGLKPTVVDD